MPAQVKYKPSELAAAVDLYFNSIRRERPATELRPTGEYTKNGMPKMERREILDGNGAPVLIEEWIVPPTITKLCLKLGISKVTWSEYSKKPKYASICEYAKEICRGYLEEELLTRDRVDGIKFALQYAYDCKEKVEVETKTKDAPLDMASLKDALSRLRSGEFDGEEENSEGCS